MIVGLDFVLRFCLVLIANGLNDYVSTKVLVLHFKTIKHFCITTSNTLALKTLNKIMEFFVPHGKIWHLNYCFFFRQKRVFNFLLPLRLKKLDTSLQSHYCEWTSARYHYYLKMLFWRKNSLNDITNLSRATIQFDERDDHEKRLPLLTSQFLHVSLIFCSMNKSNERCNKFDLKSKQEARDRLKSAAAASCQDF